MDSLSIWHWIIVILYVGIVVYPVTLILRRLGLSPWWAALSVVPIVNLFALWGLAFVSWPTEASK